MVPDGVPFQNPGQSAGAVFEIRGSVCVELYRAQSQVAPVNGPGLCHLPDKGLYIGPLTHGRYGPGQAYHPGGTGSACCRPVP